MLVLHGIYSHLRISQVWHIVFLRCGAISLHRTIWAPPHFLPRMTLPILSRHPVCLPSQITYVMSLRLTFLLFLLLWQNLGKTAAAPGTSSVSLANANASSTYVTLHSTHTTRTLLMRASLLTSQLIPSSQIRKNLAGTNTTPLHATT